MACGSFQLGRKHLVKRAKVAMRLYPQLRKQHPNQTFHADLRYDGRFALSVSDSKMPIWGEIILAWLCRGLLM